jgi:peptide/nickel transport system permease protein
LNTPGSTGAGMSTGADKQAFALAREQIMKSLGLDASIPVQYGRWVGILKSPDPITGELSYNGIFQGNFGVSLRTNRTFAEEFVARLPVTVELNIMAMLIGNLISIPLGIYSALRQDTWLDYVARNFAIGAMAIPGFWLATIIIVFGARYLNWSPPMEYVHLTVNPIANLKMMILPALIMGITGAGGGVRGLRAITLEVMRQDYVRTAWAKGLKERVVVLRHAFKNAMVPFVDSVAGTIGALIGGSVIMENIFVLPGLGRYTYNMVILREYSLVCGTTLIFGTFALVMILLTDLAYAVVDPRIRYK